VINSRLRKMIVNSENTKITVETKWNKYTIEFKNCDLTVDQLQEEFQKICQLLNFSYIKEIELKEFIECKCPLEEKIDILEVKKIIPRENNLYIIEGNDYIVKKIEECDNCDNCDNCDLEKDHIECGKYVNCQFNGLVFERSK
jgi:hypothetical protein